MIEVKNSFLSGLDLDTNLLSLKKDAYIDALNITRDAISGNQDLAVTNIIGNRLVTYSLPSGTNKCIGSYPHLIRNTIIYFVYNSNSHHLVLEYNDTTRTITKIFECLADSSTDILDFSEDVKITSINVYPREIEGDLLFFLDGLGRPTMMNIDRFKAGEYTPVTRQIINVIKAPPLSPPSCVFGSEPTTKNNYFRNKLTRFKYIYVYDDFEESVSSPISQVPLPLNILNEDYTNVITNNNVVYLSINSGDKNVKSVKLLMSYAEKSKEWSDFEVVDTIDKSDILLRSFISATDVSTTTQVSVLFSGYVSIGTVINLYLTLSPSTQTLIGTYTTIANDNVDTIASALSSSISTIGIATSAASSMGTVYFSYNNTLYENPITEITQGSFDNNNIDFPYSFYNDSTYPKYNISRSIQLFDYVPDNANAQDMPNGNVLAYGGITEGYDISVVPNVVNEVLLIPASGGSTGNLNGAVTISLDNSLQQIFSINFSGIPIAGTTVICNVKIVGTGVIVLAATYTTISGDTPSSVASAIAGSFNSLGQVASATAVGTVVAVISNTVLNPKRIYDSLNITPPAYSSINNSIPTWKWSTSRNIGMAYFDENGKTAGILYNGKINFPAYSESGSNILLPYINTRVYHQPPIEAHSFQFLFTKENTQYIYWESSDVNTSEANYIYFNVSGFVTNASKNPTTSEVLSYSFQDGDRLRLIKDVIANTVFTEAYDTLIQGLVVDPKINGVDVQGTFIKIKKSTPFSSVSYTNKFFVIEIYRPQQSTANNENQVYYECGQKYDVLLPGTAQRYHDGMIAVQDLVTETPAEFNFYNGDSYFRPRTIAITDTGTATFSVQDRNFVDFYISAVSSLEGRPNAIDKNARETYFGAVIRHGDEYEVNTNINGLNRFSPSSLIEASYTYGDIKRMKVRDKVMKIFQQFKVGYSPLFSQIHRDAAGGNIIAQTDTLLNPIQYYVGDWGIGDAPASLASYNFADYFCDTNRGIIVRSSNDGLFPLSIGYKINSWATSYIPLRKNGYNIYGAFYEKSSNYILALEEVPNIDSAKTISFDEETNAFESFLSYHPENMCALGTQFVTWKDGQLWTHDSDTYNNFYGVQYESTITLVFNVAGLQKKTWESITEVASDIFDCPVIYTNSESYSGQVQQSSLIESDFKVYEGNPSAAIKRDANSIKGLINGDTLKGNYIAIKFRKQSAANLIYLNIVSVRYIDSPLTTK